jgi:hypothetical protein
MSTAARLSVVPRTVQSMNDINMVFKLDEGQQQDLAARLPVDLLRLAHLNYALFDQLLALGTSKRKICYAFQISDQEFDSLERLRI